MDEQERDRCRGGPHASDEPRVDHRLLQMGAPRAPDFQPAIQREGSRRRHPFRINPQANPPAQKVDSGAEADLQNEVCADPRKIQHRSKGTLACLPDSSVSCRRERALSRCTEALARRHAGALTGVSCTMIMESQREFQLISVTVN